MFWKHREKGTDVQELKLEITEVEDKRKSKSFFGYVFFFLQRKWMMKCLSVLGSKLLDQVLQRSKLSPVNEVELLESKYINI